MTMPIVLVVSAFLLWPLAALWSGYVLSVMWGWFVVPALGAPPLHVGYAIGIAMVVGYMTHQIIHENDEREAGEKIVAGILEMFGRPAFALLFGWLTLKIFL